jgi:hypothetical protein
MSAYGVTVLHFTPGQLRAKRGEVVTAIRNAIDAGRPLPQVCTLPASW